jgi:ankyrin repeat protein
LLEEGAEEGAKEGSDIEPQVHYSQNPLLLAARKRREAIVKLLLEKGAKVEVHDFIDETPVSADTEEKKAREAVVELLLSAGENSTE